MILTRVHVENWRGLDAVTLDDLSPHLNLIAGPNESGKSRLFEAVRFALFESHRGSAKHKKALQSWGGAGSPRVEVGFTVDATAYRLDKTFLKGAGALLQGGGQTWRDQEAEERLAELLGLAGAPAQKADPASLSYWPLLWLEQFAAGAAPDRDLNEPTRSRIQDVLCREIGEVAAGVQGEQVLSRAREGAARYWTATFRETGELRDAVQEADAARQVREAARARSRELQGVSDGLAQVGEELGRMDGRLAQVRAELQRARARAERAQEVRLLLERQKTSVQLTQTGKEEAEREAALRREREEALRARQGDVAGVEEELRRLTERLADGVADRERAEADLDRVRAAARAAEGDLRRAHRQGERVAARSRLETLQQGLAEVGRVEAEVGRLTGRAAQIRVTQKRLGELRQAADRQTRATARLEGAAARLRVTARAPVAVEDAVLGAGETREWLCDAPRRVRIGELADVEVLPGGEDLPALRADEARCQAAVAALLEACGVRTVEEAQEQWDRARDLQGRVARARERIGELCPEGKAERQTAVSTLEARLAELGPDDPQAPTVDRAQDASTAAAEGAATAQVHRDGLVDRVTALHSEQSGCAGRLRQLQEEAARLRELVDAMPPPEDLDARVRETTAAWQSAVAGRAGLEEEYRTAGGDGAAGDLERAQAALQQVETRGGELRERRSQLLGTLQTLQGEDVHERLQDAEARWEAAVAHLALTRRWADAHRRLVETLERARAEVQERLTAPVADRVAPYLEKIFPGSRLRLSEALDVEGLSTGDTPEPFEELSGGAREQVNVIVRLGLAELFAGDGTLPVALDDALTNTDFGRVRRMHSVLYEASRRLQLLVFTCHEEAFDGLGAERVYVLAGRRGAG